MSNFLAIATVTAALHSTLFSVVSADVNGADVTTRRPGSTGMPATGVNIYLYQVTPNAARRNEDLPTRRSDGTVSIRPQVALDLHYLLSFFGEENDHVPQRLLGSVVRTLHARPILPQDAIRTVVGNIPHLGNSNLLDATEPIRFTPLSLSLEELSKLWALFTDVPHQLSIAYQASVLLIEAEETPQVALPVRGRNLYVVPFSQPVIETVFSDDGEAVPIVAGGTLRILGKQLRGEVTRIRIDDNEETPAPENVSPARIVLPLPAGLQAGVRTVQVLHPTMMGTPATLHAGVESNAVAFLLRPTIENILSSSATEITVEISPDVGKRQRVFLLLNGATFPAAGAARAYRFKAPVDNGIPSNEDDTSEISFPIGGVTPGDYLVRVQVDGAESPLEVNAATNAYNGPMVTIR